MPQRAPSRRASGVGLGRGQAPELRTSHVFGWETLNLCWQVLFISVKAEQDCEIKSDESLLNSQLDSSANSFFGIWFCFHANHKVLPKQAYFQRGWVENATLGFLVLATQMKTDSVDVC